jgi:hypothetical protein
MSSKIIVGDQLSPPRRQRQLQLVNRLERGGAVNHIILRVPGRKRSVITVFQFQSHQGDEISGVGYMRSLFACYGRVEKLHGLIHFDLREVDRWQ